jgi:hypothetical protein
MSDSTTDYRPLVIGLVATTVGVVVAFAIARLPKLMKGG